MLSFLSKALYGALTLSTMLVIPAELRAHAPVPVTVTVEDSAGASLSGASVKQASGALLGRTDTSGRLTFDCNMPCQIRVDAEGFKGKDVEISANTTISLEPAAAAQQVTVTAYRTPLGELESPVSTRTLTPVELETAAPITMDGQVRQLPGVELFRRSSSLVANPTSQGISLRGLGSTSASRTLVTSDDVPLNDPLGGWIHWEEEPELAVSSIDVVRGGASDLYGSSAIGGVMNVAIVRPTATMAEFRSSYGMLGTYDASGLAETKHGPWGVMGAGGALGTDGFIQEAPWQRGPVDIKSNVHAQNGLLLGEHDRGPLRLLVRGSGFNEDRSNGTPYQVNGTRLWRYAAGGDWQGPHDGSLAARLYGSDEHYRQTFSSISNLPNFGDPTCSYRCGEIPTRYGQIPDNELGAAALWTQPVGAGLLLLGGADVHDVRVWDREQLFGSSATLTNLSVRQRDTGLYSEALWTRKGWTVAGSVRVDWFRNFDANQTLWTGTTWVPTPNQPPTLEQTIFDPRLGISRKLWQHWAISGSGFRAFRAPTPSELYRSTQVGNQLTRPNSSLLSERATGWEAGLASQWRWGTIRTSYFLTQINRPIAAVTLNPNSSPILLMRENLGQIESKGFSLDFGLAPLHWLAVDGGYQYAHATVTKGTVDVGNWIPEVARNMATLNVRAFQPRLGTLSLQSRLSGIQYDDDANTYMLHGFFKLDAYGSHAFGSHLELFAAGENLFDRTIEVAKTPTTTLATPRIARAGINLKLGPAR
jgi:outer membrane receptor protein involved in Fe transport